MGGMQASGLVPGCVREIVQRHFDGRIRRVPVTDVEVPCPDGCLIVSRTDVHGLITHANPAFVWMSGYTLDELIGQPQNILRHPDMPRSVFQDMWATLSSGRKWRGYVKNLRKDGAHYWVYATAVPNVRHGQRVGYTSVRRKPARTEIERCEQAYARLRGLEGGDDA